MTYLKIGLILILLNVAGCEWRQSYTNLIALGLSQDELVLDAASIAGFPMPSHARIELAVSGRSRDITDWRGVYWSGEFDHDLLIKRDFRKINDRAELRYERNFPPIVKEWLEKRGFESGSLYSYNEIPNGPHIRVIIDHEKHLIFIIKAMS